MQADPSSNIEGLLDRADAMCAERGARLTALRRRVLSLVLQAPAPIGAYDLLDRLREADGKAAAPPTVYRALDFLMEQGLIHRLERLSAYIGCIGEAVPGHDHEDAHCHSAHPHRAQFLICRQCGKAVELDDHDLARALDRAARRAGFSVGAATIEAEGLCETCASSP